MGALHMKNWKNRRVFVSGGAGVIGTALVNNLLEKAAIVFVGDLKPCPLEWSGKVRYRQGDLIDLGFEEIADFAPEYYFHLAATFERSEESIGFWKENFHHNVQLSHHLISLVKEVSCMQKVIFASSYLIYDPTLYLFSTPQQQGIDLSETSRAAPRNLCGTAKWHHEQELFFLKKFFPDKQFISARIFRSYGKNSRDIISRWVHALKHNLPITLYRPEGRFDYIFAEDAAEGLLRLAVSSHNGPVNLGTGRARSVNEVIAILKQFFPHPKIELINVDIPYESSQADMTLFHSLTGWKGSRPLEQTIPHLLESS